MTESHSINKGSCVIMMNMLQLNKQDWALTIVET